MELEISPDEFSLSSSEGARLNVGDERFQSSALWDALGAGGHSGNIICSSAVHLGVVGCPSVIFFFQQNEER
jgi:hypothetical protein